MRFSDSSVSTCRGSLPTSNGRWFLRVDPVDLTVDPSDGHIRWTADVGGKGRVIVTVAPDGTAFANTESDVVRVLDRDGLRRGLIRGEYLTASPEALQAGRIAVCDFDHVTVIGPADWTEGLPDPLAEPTDKKPPGTVERVGDWVIINGVRVPVRKRGAI